MYAVGRPEVVLPAVLRFQRDLSNRCGLILQWGKTEWFTWNRFLPPNAPPDLKYAGVINENDGEFMRGFMCYGIPLGTEIYVTHMLQQKAEDQHHIKRSKILE